jgi:hypothetical protein
MNANESGRAVTGTFAARERVRVMQETKQFQATLVGMFAPIKNRAKQAVDAFSQHTPAPRFVQHVTQSIPSSPKLVEAQQVNGGVETGCPSLLPGVLFGQGAIPQK